MAPDDSHYETLGVEPTSDPAVIRRAYLDLARRHHPDGYAPGSSDARRAEARMKEVNRAWSVLGDTARRRAYDLARASDRPGPARFAAAEHDVADLDEIDPRLLDDTPTGATPAPRSLTFLPVAVLAGSFGTIFASMLLRAPALLALGLAGLVLAGALFFTLPLLTMARAARHERSAPPRSGR